MYMTMNTKPTHKEQFRDMLATSGVRKIMANAIRSERVCPTITDQEICMFECIRDGLRTANQNFTRQVAHA